MSYCILEFHDEIAAEKMLKLTIDSPFIKTPIYHNNKKNVWIVQPHIGTLEYFKKSGGVNIFETDIKEEIVIPSKIKGKDKINKHFKTNHLDKFKKFANHLDYN